MTKISITVYGIWGEDCGALWVFITRKHFLGLQTYQFFCLLDSESSHITNPEIYRCS